MGYSMGSFILSIAGAADDRLNACVLVGGGNLDGPGEYWDRSKPMCQALPYKALSFLGDRPAAIYALHALARPTLIFNGLADTVVAIPTHGEPFFHDLRRRTAVLCGHAPTDVFDYRLIPNISHRPFFVTRDVALWLEQQARFSQLDRRRNRKNAHHAHQRLGRGRTTSPWTAATSPKTAKAARRLSARGVPGLPREQLSVCPAEEWQKQKAELIYESWVTKARQAMEAEVAPSLTRNCLAIRLHQPAARHIEVLIRPGGTSAPRRRATCRRRRARRSAWEIAAPNARCQCRRTTGPASARCNCTGSRPGPGCRG